MIKKMKRMIIIIVIMRFIAVSMIVRVIIVNILEINLTKNHLFSLIINHLNCGYSKVIYEKQIVFSVIILQ